MKVRLESNTTVIVGKETYGPGGMCDVPDEVAKALIRGGSAEVVTVEAAHSNAPPTT